MPSRQACVRGPWAQTAAAAGLPLLGQPGAGADVAFAPTTQAQLQSFTVHDMLHHGRSTVVSASPAPWQAFQGSVMARACCACQSCASAQRWQAVHLASLEPKADGALDGAPGVQNLPLLSDLQHAPRCQRPPNLPREVHQLAPALWEGSPRRLAGSAGGPWLALPQYL